MFTFTQSMVTSKNVSHVRKSSRPSPSVFPPTRLIVGARNCVRNWPGFEATWSFISAIRGLNITAIDGVTFRSELKTSGRML